MASSDVTDEDIGKMVLYSGMNYDNTQIASAVGFSASTVSRHLNNVHDEAAASDSPEQVFWSYVMAYLLGSGFRSDLASTLSPGA